MWGVHITRLVGDESIHTYDSALSVRGRDRLKLSAWECSELNATP